MGTNKPFAQALRYNPGRFLPVLIGILVYLAAITLETLLFVDGIDDSWHHEVGGRMSVQLPAYDDDSVRWKSITGALTRIQALPEVAHVELITQDQLAAELRPWLRLDAGAITNATSAEGGTKAGCTRGNLSGAGSH